MTPENLNELHKSPAGRPARELHALLINLRVCHVKKAKKAILGLALDVGKTSLFRTLLDLEAVRC
jgi:hypothetical protein